MRDWPPCPPIQRDSGRRSRPGVNPFISALTVARCPATFPGVWPQLRDTLSTSRSVGRGTGAFIYALSADETSPALAAPRHAITALFSCRFQCPCPPLWIPPQEKAICFPLCGDCISPFLVLKHGSPLNCSIPGTDRPRQEGMQEKCPKALRRPQQRVAIARALASNAPLLLDKDAAAGIAAILKECAHQRNKCVVIVTHSNELAKLADTVFRLKKGELQTS